MSEPIARVVLESEISAIFNHDHSCAVLLDQKNGRYWRTSGKLLQILLILSESTDGFSIEELRDRLNVTTGEQETQLNAAILGGHLKSGRVWSLENRP